MLGKILFMQPLLKFIEYNFIYATFIEIIEYNFIYATFHYCILVNYMNIRILGKILFMQPLSKFIEYRNSHQVGGFTAIII